MKTRKESLRARNRQALRKLEAELHCGVLAAGSAPASIPEKYLRVMTFTTPATVSDP
jgi:hypothetical protein